MDREAADDKYAEALRRIAVELLALAALADRAGGCSRMVRCLVLWLLSPGLKAAYAFAHDTGYLLLPVMPPAGESASSDGPADTVCLAAEFRALAAAFFAIALRILPSAWVARTDCRSLSRPNSALLDDLINHAVGGLRPCYADTS